MDMPIEDNVNEQIEHGGCEDCAYGNYPDFCSEFDETSASDGAREAAYILGFVGALNNLGLSEGSLMDIIRMKISCGYQKELTRMQLASQERIADIYAKNKVAFSPNDY